MFSSQRDTTFQPDCPHDVTMAAVIALHLPVVLPICSFGLQPSHSHLPTILQRILFLLKRARISCCCLQSRTLTHSPNGKKKNAKTLEVETMMGEEREVGEERIEIWKGKIRFFLELAESNDSNKSC